MNDELSFFTHSTFVIIIENFYSTSSSETRPDDIHKSLKSSDIKVYEDD